MNCLDIKKLYDLSYNRVSPIVLPLVCTSIVFPLFTLAVSLYWQELNVRSITTSQDKGKYGVSLKAEPDHVILGKRLKGDFKKVSTAIRLLTDNQLQEFRTKGEIVVEGHTLSEGELRLSYTSADAATSQYEAHSDSQVKSS